MGFLDFLKKDDKRSSRNSGLMFGPPPTATQPDPMNAVPDDFDAPPQPSEPFKEPGLQDDLKEEIPAQLPEDKQLPADDGPLSLLEAPETAAMPNPFEDSPPQTPPAAPVPQEHEDLEVPDLPDFHEDIPEQGPQEQPQSAPAEPPSPTPAPEQDLPSLPDEKPVTYVPEERPVEELADRYVETHIFFTLLQDVKTIRRSIKDADETVRHWEENDDALATKTETLLDAFDDLQEQLIAIDTELFER